LNTITRIDDISFFGVYCSQTFGLFKMTKAQSQTTYISELVLLIVGNNDHQRHIIDRTRRFYSWATSIARWAVIPGAFTRTTHQLSVECCETSQGRGSCKTFARRQL